MAMLELCPEACDAEVPPVEACLAHILEGSDFPALSRQIIDTLSTIDEDAASLERFANVVLREYSLTLSVVKTANTTHYRRSGQPIQSATHAMMMLGARKLRQLAGGLLLFENYARRSPELKELMLLSLLTANHARATAVRLQLQDPEEAHLCGMFRNLGEVLVAGHFPDAYQRITALVRDEGRHEAAATKEVLGFPLAELGVAVARHWRLPDAVVHGMHARATTSASLTAAVTAFSHDLTYALYRVDASPSEITDAVDRVLEQHRPKLRLSRDQVGGVVADALEETRELFVNPDIATDRLRFRQLAGAARSALGACAAVRDEDTHVAPAVPDPSLRTSLRAELDESVDPASGAEIAAVLLQSLEAIARGGPFDRVVACFLTADRTRLVARSGLGESVDTLLAPFDFPVSAQGGPVVALTMRRQPVYLPTDRHVTPAERQWAASLGVAQFGVFPLIVLGKVVGCLYCDRLRDAPVPDRATVRFTRSITELLVDAIGRRRHG